MGLPVFNHANIGKSSLPPARPTSDWAQVVCPGGGGIPTARGPRGAILLLPKNPEVVGRVEARRHGPQLSDRPPAVTTFRTVRGGREQKSPGWSASPATEPGTGTEKRAAPSSGACLGRPHASSCWGRTWQNCSRS